MAKAIKITPVLKGIDALNFFKKLTQNSSKKANAETLGAIKHDAKKLRRILNVGK